MPSIDSDDSLRARSLRLRIAFDIVMDAFRASPDEAAQCWRMAVDNIEAAEAAFHADAAMIRAGWRPLDEQAAAFLERAVPPELSAEHARAAERRSRR